MGPGWGPHVVPACRRLAALLLLIPQWSRWLGTSRVYNIYETGAAQSGC